MKLFSVFLFITMYLSVVFSEDKTVLLAILARDKEHCLPYYLHCIDELDYDKKKITIYINTNNNQDNTEVLLKKWANKNGKDYKKVIFDSHHVKEYKKVNPHEWFPKMFSILAEIRNKSLKKAIEENCDYYFVVDCDNFIHPTTLKTLAEKKKPIIAPMLRSIPNKLDPYSNFFCDVNNRGYYKSHPDYMHYLYRSKVGTFKVPVVHCTYLIDCKYLKDLSYIDGTKDYEFVIFSRLARKNGVEQFICNEKDFGLLIHFGEGEKTLQQEREMIANVLPEHELFQKKK